MYKNRKISEKERLELIEHRKKNSLPWHSPPHFVKKDRVFLITATCFEHARIFDAAPNRLEKFTPALLDFLSTHCEKLYLWVVLANHYHFVAHILDLDVFSKQVQAFHSITAIAWNKEDKTPGRKIFHSYSDRFMRTTK